jgi:hypothetical protein
LKTDGSGNLGWTAAGGGGAIDGLSDAKLEGTNFTGSMILGHQTTGTLDAAESNTAVGIGSLDAITSGDKNVAIGFGSLTSNTTGNLNSALGVLALQSNTTGNYNEAFGYAALTSNTTASFNSAFGYASLRTNTTGGYNVAFGHTALTANSTGNNNTALGHRSLDTNTTGSGNIAIGYLAGNDITTGTDNTIIGSAADASANNAANQIVIGSGAVGTTNNTVLLGNGSITNWLPTDDNEVDLGSSAKEMKDLYVDGVAYTDALGFGTVAMTLPTADGSANQILKTDGSGTLSWTTNVSGASSIDALSDAFFNSSAANLVVGHIPGNITSGTSNSAFSNSGLMDLTSGLYNNVFGSDALASVTTGNGNTAMGHKTMQFLVDGDENTGFGQGAMINLTSGSNNTAVGVHAGRGNQTGRYNTSVGQESLDGTGNNASNTAVGFRAGKGITTGSDNVFIGKNAGDTIDDGSSNVVIGDDADVSATNSSNQIVIGKGATGIGDDKAVIGNTSVTDVYMAQDGEATVHAAGITFSDGTSQTTAASSSVPSTIITPGMIDLNFNSSGASKIKKGGWNRPAIELPDATSQLNLNFPLPSAYSPDGSNITVKVLYSSVDSGDISFRIASARTAIGESTEDGTNSTTYTWSGSATANYLLEGSGTISIASGTRMLQLVIGRQSGDANTGVMHIYGAEIVW